MKTHARPLSLALCLALSGPAALAQMNIGGSSISALGNTSPGLGMTVGGLTVGGVTVGAGVTVGGLNVGGIPVAGVSTAPSSLAGSGWAALTEPYSTTFVYKHELLDGFRKTCYQVDTATGGKTLDYPVFNNYCYTGPTTYVWRHKFLDLFTKTCYEVDTATHGRLLTEFALESDCIAADGARALDPNPSLQGVSPSGTKTAAVESDSSARDKTDRWAQNAETGAHAGSLSTRQTAAR